MMKCETYNTRKFVPLGELIELCDERNSNGVYGEKDVRGVANTKGFITTKADLKGRDLSKFFVIRPKCFAFNRRTTRNGERLGLGFNDTGSDYICTEDYIAFKVKDEKQLSPDYLYIYFLRNEFDRAVRRDSWGSATEFFNWEDMCHVKIPLPSIAAQHELVGAYEGLRRLAEENEAMLDPLAKACEAFIIDCKKKYDSEPLGKYIEECKEKNTTGIYGIDELKGASWPWQALCAR